jgi:hypothetical protein
VVLLVDGTVAAEREFAPGARHAAKRDLTARHSRRQAHDPPGNRGADWATIGRITLSPFGPALRAMGKIGRNSAVLWLRRAGNDTPPTGQNGVTGIVTLPASPPETIASSGGTRAPAGNCQKASATVSAGQSLSLTTPAVSDDVAAYVIPAGTSTRTNMADQTTLSPGDYTRLATEAETNLRAHVLAKWYPAAVDRERGGFHQNFAEDWSRAPGDERGIVYQSRLTWLASQAALRYPDQARSYVAYARHGFDFLHDRLWDREHGGFFLVARRERQPEVEKHAYGNAFGIYAVVAAYQATRDARALDLAQTRLCLAGNPRARPQKRRLL